MDCEKVILLTGGSSGIGFETSIALALQGHRVYAAARRSERMEPLREFGVVPLFLDVTDDASIQAVVRNVLDSEGHIDVLVNNAGYGYFGAIENVTLEDARNQMEVNVFGMARLCQLVLPTMRRQHFGRIINIASVAGRSVLYYGGWYHVSKYSVEALSDALRIEVKPFGIDVVLIEPGAIKTNWGAIAAKHLHDNSVGTVYEPTATKEADTMRAFYESDIPSNPSVVRKAICRAVNSRRPCVRYHPGRGSYALILLHWLLPARWWDALNRFIIHKLAPHSAPEGGTAPSTSC